MKVSSDIIFIAKPKSKLFEDLDGRKFSRLAVIGFAGKSNGRTDWYCKCDCGNIVKVIAKNLKNGRTTSCGCLRDERVSESHLTHGHSSGGGFSLTYRTWGNMLQRCLNKNNPAYHNYGGRGIKICNRWLRFENFLEDMGERQKGMTIERIDNNGNYEPGNCRWATRKEQCNNKRNNHFLTFNGKTKTVVQWSEIYNIKSHTISKRIKYGWTVEKSLNKKK